MNISVFLLLTTPLFFAFGWFAGRIDMKTVIRQVKQMPKRVFDSIDALIDNKSARASDTLRDIIDQEPQLTELQLSLGKLYRNRGENDLAIKLHSKLLNSQYLFSNDEKDKARLELALDFQSAGLIDRAETLLLQLVKSEIYSHKAQDLLLDVYQQDKNWKEAIEIAHNLATSDYSYHTEIAQFYCELAQESLIKSNHKLANEHINTALTINKKCARASILLGELLFSQEKYQEAIQIWQSIEKQNFLYLPMVIEKIFEAYIRTSQIREGLTLLKGYAEIYPQINLHAFIYQKLITYETSEDALNFLRIAMKNQPNSKVATLIIDLYLNHTSNIIKPKVRPDIEIIKNLLLEYNEKFAKHKCGRCNFKSSTFFWQCPVCHEWESINPNCLEI